MCVNKTMQMQRLQRLIICAALALSAGQECDDPSDPSLIQVNRSNSKEGPLALGGFCMAAYANKCLWGERATIILPGSFQPDPWCPINPANWKTSPAAQGHIWLTLGGEGVGVKNPEECFKLDKAVAEAQKVGANGIAFDMEGCYYQGSGRVGAADLSHPKTKVGDSFVHQIDDCWRGGTKLLPSMRIWRMSSISLPQCCTGDQTPTKIIGLCQLSRMFSRNSRRCWVAKGQNVLDLPIRICSCLWDRKAGAHLPSWGSMSEEISRAIWLACQWWDDKHEEFGFQFKHVEVQPVFLKDMLQWQHEGFWMKACWTHFGRFLCFVPKFQIYIQHRVPAEVLDSWHRWFVRFHCVWGVSNAINIRQYPSMLAEKREKLRKGNNCEDSASHVMDKVARRPSHGAVLWHGRFKVLMAVTLNWIASFLCGLGDIVLTKHLDLCNCGYCGTSRSKPHRSTHWSEWRNLRWMNNEWTYTFARWR